MAVLLADIGGTNARFCWYQKGKLGHLFDYKCDGFKTVYDVIEKALMDFPQKITGIVIAGAGPVKKWKHTMDKSFRLESFRKRAPKKI